MAYDVKQFSEDTVEDLLTAAKAEAEIEDSVESLTEFADSLRSIRSHTNYLLSLVEAHIEEIEGDEEDLHDDNLGMPDEDEQ